MTILEALQNDRLVSEFTENQINIIAIQRGINIRLPYTVSSLKDFELLKADLMSELLLSPDFTEGKLSIKYDRYILLDYVKKIGQKYDDSKLLGIEVSDNSGITDLTELW